MKQPPNALYRSLRLLVLAGACLASTAYADGYADVRRLMGENKYSEAMTRVDNHLATNPGDPQMRFLKGVIESSQDKPLNAISTFNKLTQDYPELPEPYNNLAVLYAGQGSYDKARLALEMAIRTNPGYATAHENLGDVYARLASQAYDKALALDSGNAAVLRKLAVLKEVFAPNVVQPGTPASPPVVNKAVLPADKPAPASATAIPSVMTQYAAAVPTSAAVAAGPAAASNTASASASASASVPLDAEANQAVEAAVLTWAQAWSDKDMNAYLKAYSPRFEPAGDQSLNAWEKERDERITDKKSITVTLSNLKIRAQGNHAMASFHQSYTADGLSVSSQNTLELEKSAQNWLITRESTER